MQNLQCQTSTYWQQKINYIIDVSLNDKDHTLDGFIKMDYFNNSPDTLHFIWFHLWANAYKNDRTAFSDQLIENGNTNFYFVDNDKRGYINRLDFRVNNTIAKTEDHPQHQDIIKLILPQPLAPKSKCKIETPFHLKLPYNFSRGGHINQSYQITQWYPKPAVYDKIGWHPMPYLDQGEFYSEFGNYQVKITLPNNYVVAATGNLQDNVEKDWLSKRKLFYREAIKKSLKKNTDNTSYNEVGSSKTSKTVEFVQNNVHDFAWFADKTFSIKTDTLKLPSGKIIQVNAYYFSEHEDVWRNSISFIKKAILTKSNWVAEYPYDVVTAVDNAANASGGMEYPTITLLTSGGSEAGLERVINHEVGHNWFYGILANNERNFAWMDEGMNTYYDKRYAATSYTAKDGNMFVPKISFIKKRFPAYPEKMALNTIIAFKKDQPINTLSQNFSNLNYDLISYEKTGEWMQLLEKKLGQTLFDSCIKKYYQEWSFKHPYPEDFKNVIEQTTQINVDTIFSLLSKKGLVEDNKQQKDIRFSTFFNFKDTEKHHYIFASPAIGYNFYNKFMFGAIIHNYTLVPSKFQFIIAPLYSFATKNINGIGKVSYNWFPGNNGQKAEVSLTGAFFNDNSFTDTTGNLKDLKFYKIVPSFKFVFANKNARSTVTKFVRWKTYLISQQSYLFTKDTVNQIDIITFPFYFSYINQLQFVIENIRKLYPYKAALQIEQGDGFVRTNFTGNYFFNYAKGGGVNVRMFVGKFFYTGNRNQLFNEDYLLNLTGPKGSEDYTYSNYFAGRNEYNKLFTHQIMIRDGAFKVGTDLLNPKIGKTDNWLAAINFTSDIPSILNPFQALPIKIPLKLFFDIGTYAEAWQPNPTTGRFVYDGGVQISACKNLINVYIPVLYSKEYKNYFNLYVNRNRFINKITFSVDIQNFTLRKFIKQYPF